MARIREATNPDRDAIRLLYLRTFPKAERQIVATLATNLLEEDTRPATFGLVAEIEGAVVGHIAFSPVTIEGHTEWGGCILAPLGVAPEHQRRRIGSGLVRRGIERLTECGADVLFVYGDPDYYGRFGFRADVASGYLPPYALQYPFGWQALALDDGVEIEPGAKLSCVASLRDPALW